ncbi:S8 family peptidase [soil metagenome]
MRRSNQGLRVWCLVLLTAYIQLLPAQQLPDSWFNLDPAKDKVMGVSTNKAYDGLLKGKTAVTVIVAVIDGGTDIEHPDLKTNIWTNTQEIEGNGIDDDHNGFIDDMHGWNFIGGKTGDVQYDQLEKTRIFKKYFPIFENHPDVVKARPEEYKLYVKAKESFLKERADVETNIEQLTITRNWMEKVKKSIGKDSLKVEDVIAYPEADSLLLKKKERIIRAMSTGNTFESLLTNMENSIKANQIKFDYNYNADFDARSIVGDNYEDVSEHNYGNNSLKGPESRHGTHVAGIIGAIRGNNVGMDGVADKVQLMILRVVPNGDERDKDVANAIRYAVDNGAKVINMSFGKNFGFNKIAVDEAVQYAISKDVLIIHAAGNEALNLDSAIRYPNPIYQNKKGNAWKYWIDVGAVAANGTPGVFSNYGKKYVDLFAPGVKIYSTLPDNDYGNLNGTSMAAPVCAGVAALIRSYFPKLTAPDVKKIMMKSVTPIKEEVQLPGKKEIKVKWSALCKSGGVVNAYQAVLIANKLK